MSTQTVSMPEPDDVQSPALAVRGGGRPGGPVAGSGLDALAEELVAQARESGIALTGPGGVLSGFTSRVLQTALEAELTEHLGHQHGQPPGPGGNVRNGHSAKTVRTEVGDIQLRVPRDRAGTFDPVLVPKHVRRLAGFDEQVLSLYAKGMTSGDIVAHLQDMYGSQVSKELVSRVTDAVLAEMAEWANRPLEPVYPVLLIDAIFVRIRDGQVATRPIYVAMGISVDGDRDVLGMWVGPPGGEGAKVWLGMLTELKNRGVRDVLIACCDGLKGLPDAITATWPRATVQTCVVHLIRNSLRYASKKDWSAVTAGLKPVYTAPTVAAAEARFAEFADAWRDRYPAMVAMWERSWTEVVPFLDFPVELRRLIYTTNGIESLNARFRAAVRRRGHFPTEQAALKILYLTVRERRPNRTNPTGKINGWKAILNTLAMTYGERLTIN
jgi:putative transposase